MAKCRVCGYRITPFFSLGKMPLVNSFLKKDEIAKEKKFDLTVAFCEKCYLVQLVQTVNPKDLFEHYLYFSSVTKAIIAHSKKTADSFCKRFHLTSKSLVLEIGSNDGVHLQFYKNKGVQILGIDPAKNIAAVANKKGIPTLPVFFNFALAKKLVEKQGIKADLIYGANVFAHVPEILDFVKGVKLLLKAKGTAIFEFPYVSGLLENKFDIIYHEHVFYYSLIALQNLFKKVDLEIYDVEFTPMQGGSLRIFVGHKNIFPLSSQVILLAKKEMKKGFNSINLYRNTEKNIKKLKTELIDLLEALKKEKKRIGGYSAPAKGNILLNYFGIKEYLDFIVDKAIVKQGLYTPGTHLLVEDPKKIEERHPDYLLILCWNIADEVIDQYGEFQNRGGKFIIPIPKVKIL